MNDRAFGVCVGEGVWADGVLVRSGAPLGTLWVPLTSGLTVFYGRNGVGKSKVLEMIGKALRGVAPPEGDLSVHLAFGGPFESFDVGLLLALGVAAGVVPRYVEEPERYREHALDDQDSPNFASEYAADIATFLQRRAHEFGLAEGFCHSPRLALQATGSASAPAWKLSLSVVPTDLVEVIRRTPVGVAFERLMGTEHLDELRRQENLPSGYPFVVAEIGAAVGESAELEQLVAEENEPWFAPIYDFVLRRLNADDAIACRVGDEDVDLDQRTVAALRRGHVQRGGYGSRFVPSDWEPQNRELIDSVDGEHVGWAPGLRRDVSDIGASAQEILASLTGDSLAGLDLRLRHPNEWFDNSPVEWLAADLAGRWIPVDGLGSGGRRWSRLAISIALQGYSFRSPQILLVDEPERGLHPTAQLAAARGFAAVAGEEVIGDVPVAAVFVATHSPAFLTEPGVRLVHVSRGPGGNVVLDPIEMAGDLAGVDALAFELGIARADVLQATRAFIFVEGEHDLAVLRAVFGDTFRKRHAVVSAMRGAANVEAHLTAEHILTFSEAKIRVVLDKIGGLTAKEWAAACTAFEAGKATEARRLLDGLPKPGRGREAEWLAEAGRVALERGWLDRIELVGLDKPDIIQYLPVEALVPGGGSWNDLVGEWRRSGAHTQEDFKAWIKRSKGASFNAKKLAEIAERLTDLADLPRVIEDL